MNAVPPALHPSNRVDIVADISEVANLVEVASMAVLVFGISDPRVDAFGTLLNTIENRLREIGETILSDGDA